MDRFTLLCIVAVSATATLSAQDSTARGATGRMCYRAPAPKPACSGFFLTNFGGYMVLGAGGRGSPLRGVVDWGVMTNVSTRDAVGASLFVTLDEAALAVGPAVRYRRWMPGTGSLELAVGTPLATGLTEMKPGLLFGLVKWNTSGQFGVAVRPEIIRESVFVGCGPSACNYGVRSRGRVSIGMETGGVPGLVLTGVGSASVLAILVMLAGVRGD